MSMTQIHDLAFEIQGDNITLKQGHIEPECVVLHKIHLKHIASLMNINADGEEASPQLVEYLFRLRDDAQELYEFLGSVGRFPPSSNEDEDVRMARELMETANHALALWGPA